ncbi:DUF2520 domain-containing protein [Legionella qingyii]|uniref:DUF2520 domain-containing protein n=1 Tax=Legionella qingyii TaxID=2184757 RepID=A0A317U3D6_9GAMM|nr:DUF2520 domain-containing protein [Legionella qingyii]PWY55869.1 DUF2520 domain-containing protein [Legionella qingyii]RUR23036.1 DUF2520 domain-containing protein [Legionella qingyii]RUR26882.1 DUF2520 domain-containing protein [Legionella qingyii]
MKCNLIGAGRLGKNIALALFKAQRITSVSICNRSFESTQNAHQELGFGQVIDKMAHLPAAEITWICCNDDAIENVVDNLAHSITLKPGSFVIHSSGVLSSALLAPLRKQGCFVASFHPLKAFKTNYLEPTAFKQVDCILEGDLEVCEWLKRSFTQLGAHLITINPEAKAAYHAAACMASNYLITLAACSEQLFLNAGINSQQSRQMMVNLMQGNLDNLLQTKHIAETLTGPLARGDIQTIALHLNSIDNPETKRLYQTAALATLPMTQLSVELKQKIRDLCS